ncbi:GNAT family N-acetyltransferase [Filimonas effusa]|uniref:GNAT family N-acetyltransferase n=1 Tax=Filimonas effusa TaxID=2508721 RepID=A0A4Q1D0I4_9BACT|nr:GNAT family N-acetyltransferase [Filimonas effusa]RXK81253.1 GNAT family N-acetyltransferase [Filimonas effusa]
MEHLVIRPLNNEDASKAVELILPIQQIEFNVPVTIDDQPDLLDIEACYHRTGGCFWGAFSGGQLVGTIALIVTPDNNGVIRKMFVKKEYRGKEAGIAQRLLNTLIKYSEHNGVIHLYLGTVEALKAAQRFYERNGFESIPKGNLPKSFPLMAVDTLFYSRKL